MTAPRLLLLLAVAAVAGGAADSPAGGRRALQQAPTTRTADVIVVGAGMSGMAAARTLKDKGVNVMVLEGRMRVGGRCWTRELAGPNKSKVAVDLGAGWIHGVTGNPITALAQRAGVALGKQTTNYDNAQLFLSNSGLPGAAREASDADEARWEGLLEAFESELADLQDEMEGEASDPQIDALVAKHLGAVRGHDRDALRYLLNTSIEHEYSGSITDLSLWFDGGGDEYPGGDKFVVGGYQRLVEFLGQGIDTRLGHKVTRIDSTQAGAISLTTSAGAQFTARKGVVVAVPLGVLQRGVIQFLPGGLPEANRAAMAQLGMGLLNKAVLVFPYAFWGQDYGKVEVLNRVAPATNPGSWSETYSLLPITGQPVLVAFNAADTAWALERTLKSQAEYQAHIMAVLRNIFGPAVPQPIGFVATEWGKDEFSYGSYSYTRSAPGGDVGFRRAHLGSGKPMAGGRIVFAGEHTSPDHPATTHGAFQSGLRAAGELAAVL